MARDSVNKEQWTIVRKLWEADPVVSFQEIATQLGVTRQCVRQKSLRDGWVKRLDMSAIEAKAHAAADSKFTENAVEEAKEEGGVHIPPADISKRGEISRSLAVVPEGSTPEQAQEIADKSAVDQRTKLIDRQRQEANHARAQIYAAIKAAGTKGGYERAKIAKTLTESFRVLHELERRAWGMDSGDGGGKTPPPAAIVVHMQQGVKIGN